MFRRDLLKGAGAIGGAALLIADSAMADRRTARGSNQSARVVGPFIETRDGTQLFYRDWGSGAPLVFISGWALTSDCWGYQMGPLSDSGLRCIAYDRRGHGRSSDPGRGFDYDSLADDLAAVLDALDLKNVTLVTHSMAGGEAIRYLTRHGSKRVARVALVAATLPFLTKTADNPDGIDPAVFDNARRNVLLRDFPKALRDNMRPFGVAETSEAMLDWIARPDAALFDEGAGRVQSRVDRDRLPRRAGEDRSADVDRARRPRRLGAAADHRAQDCGTNAARDGEDLRRRAARAVPHAHRAAEQGPAGVRGELS